MSATITIPLWLIYGYLIAGGLTAAWFMLWEFPHGHPSPGRELRRPKFWVRLPLVVGLMVLVWPYGIWDHVTSRRNNRRAMERYRAQRRAEESR